MKSITKAIYKWQLPKLLSRMCEDRISRSGEAGSKINCFVVALDKETEPFLLVSALDGDNLVGSKWNGSSYSEESTLPIASIMEHDLFITHYYGLNTIKYFGIYDFIINKITKWPYIKIRIARLFDKADQYIFNKKKLVTKERIELLKFMVTDHAERNHDGISDFNLMTKLYSVKWVLHPNSETQTKKLKLYLDSFVQSGDLSLMNDEYIVTGKAISSIEKYEEEERRHGESVKMQKRALWLTLIIALLAIIQAGLIKLPAIIDLTK